MKRKSYKICFSGHVQGVGFRYRTNELARGFEVAGYVKNLPTGDVELVVEGDETEVDTFLQSLRERMAANIHSERVVDSAVQGFETFSIVR